MSHREQIHWWHWKRLWAGLIENTAQNRSPVLHLLHTNLPPAEEEIQFKRDVISITESNKSSPCLKTLIYEGHSKLVLYPNPQNAFHFTATHQAVLSPIHRIPLEILETIFIALLESPDVPVITWDSHQRYPGPDAPWSLCQVSRLWRRTALSISSLWSHIPSINLDDNHTRAPKFLALLTEILKRSRSAPLDIHFHSSSPFEGPHPAMDLLLPHSPRWRRARIELPLPTLSLFAHLKGSLQSLQELVVRTWVHGLVTSHAAFDFFQEAPQLRKVAIYGLARARLLLHSSQSELENNQASRGILSSPTLTSLTIIGLQHPVMSWPVNMLPHLVVLRIRFNPWTPPQSFLNSLTIPSLEELQLVSDMGISPSSISAMISRSHHPCRLKKLFIRTRHANMGHIADLLWHIPLLTHLNVNLPSLEDIAALTDTDSGSALTPLLQICEFYVTEPISVDMTHQLNSFATSRCDASGKPRHVDSGELQHLRAIYLDFSARGTSELQQQVFHTWPTTTSVSRRAAKLAQLKQRLIPHIPEVFFMSIPSNSREILKFSTSCQATKLLSLIEATHITQATDVYTSGLHQIMHRLSFWYPRGHSKHKLGVSASRILEKWYPIFKISLKDFRWAIKDMNSLMYISQSNSIRSSAQAIKITLELQDPDIAPTDLPWPPKGFRL